MGFNRGLSANRKSPVDVMSNGVSNLSQTLSQLNNEMIVGRVTDIILDANYPNIESYGGLNGIGTILYERVDFISPGGGVAKPFYPQMSSYPLVNELVLLFQLPNTNIGNNTSIKTYYYINMVNLWNHPHHNAYPNPNSGDLPANQRKDYQESQAGSVRRVTDESTEINLNSLINPSQQTFIERTNIHSLLPFAGDTIYQGRWGNSIRFGSTAKPFKLDALNNWSSTGTNGDPIIILRNGQPVNTSNEGWVPITENINTDLSSIYLTSTQNIPITPSSERYFSYTPKEGEVPTSPSQYKGKQVIINSGRLLFNTNEDHIMLSSQRTISFEAVKGFNFDTPANFVIDVGTSIKLGSKDATEPLVKGEVLYKNLTQIVDALITLVDVMEVQQLWPGGVATPDGGTAITARTTRDILDNVKKDLVNIKSKVSKTV